ncbi:hypothetical protein FRC11_014690 [Ceratobasidium sp. 423]|nr:hypothetical protein FRC11_014690 [Ceratobasidium sp. 423]
MANNKAKWCEICTARASTNRSGTVKCNGKTPCTWCKNKKLVCSYKDTSLDQTPENTNNAPATSASPPETSMTLIDKTNGSRTIRFSPDPENLGEIDATEASEFCLPDELPIDNYMALVRERKRKHIESLTKHELETEPTAPAKRIRGGMDGGINAEGVQPDFQPPPPPPPPPPVQPIQGDALAMALQAIATANTTTAESNATTQQMLAQVLERMDNNMTRRGKSLHSYTHSAAAFSTRFHHHT